MIPFSNLISTINTKDHSRNNVNHKSHMNGKSFRDLMTTAILFCLFTFTNNAMAQWNGTGTASDPWWIAHGGESKVGGSSIRAYIEKDSILRIKYYGGESNMADFWNTGGIQGGEAPWWFNTASRNAIKAVIMEDGITNIGERAFKDCNNLTSTSIPNTVTKINAQAFYNCTSLLSVIIPSNVTTIGDRAFYNCTNLVAIANMSIRPQKINSNVFEGLSVSTIYLATPDESVENYKKTNVWNGFKFAAPYFLIDENLEGDLDAVILGLDGSALFFEYQKNNPKLPKVLTVYDFVKNKVQMVVGYNSNGLPERLVFDDIDYNVKYDSWTNSCNITSQTSNGVIHSVGNIKIDNLWDRYKDDAKNLALWGVGEILDKTLKKSAELPFVDNASSKINAASIALELILDVIGMDKKMSNDVKGAYYSMMLSFSTIGVLVDCGNAFTAAIGGVVTLPLTFLLAAKCASSVYGLLESRKKLINLEKTDDTKKTDNKKRNNASHPVTAILNGSTLEISGNGALTTKELDKYKDKKMGITTLIIRGEVTTIPGSAFSGYTNLKNVHIDNSPIALSLPQGSPYWRSFKDCPIQTLHLGRDFNPNNTAVAPFTNMTTLSTLTIGSDVTNIGRDFFSGCNGLTEVIIPNSVTTISTGAFYGCERLTSLTIGNNVETIGKNSFQNCKSLKSVTIPKSVSLIGDNAFNGCEQLADIVIEDGKTQLSLPQGSPYWYTFKGCSIKTLYLGRDLYPNDKAVPPFSDVTTLSTLTIGNEVTNIGRNFFNRCTSLKQITNHATTPQAVKANAFGGIDFCNILFVVPENSENLYKKADVWEKFYCPK